MNHSISRDPGAHEVEEDDDGVEIVIKETGPNRYSMVATATFDQPVGRVWAVFRDFQKLLDVALPGLVSDFEWLNGGSRDRVPARFQFVASGALLREEVYHRSDDEYVLRYRVLEPALGILEYDAELKLAPISDEQTVYTATRQLTLEPGAIDGLAGLAALETQNLKTHFAQRP